MVLFFLLFFVTLQAKQVNIKNENFALQLFEGRKVRVAWDAERASDHIPRVENGNAEALDILPGEGV